jgi:hypothetical protein
MLLSPIYIPCLLQSTPPILKAPAFGTPWAARCGARDGLNFCRAMVKSLVYLKAMAISGTDLLEVPTIHKAYFSGLCKGTQYLHKIWSYMVLYLHCRILKFPLMNWDVMNIWELTGM